MMFFNVLVLFLIQHACGEWVFNETMMFQVIGGSEDGKYVSTENAGIDAEILLTTDKQDAKWTLQPYNVGSNDWGFIVKKTLSTGWQWLWHLDFNNWNQIRAYQPDLGLYGDDNQFILVPVSWWNATFIIKNCYSDEYLYINNAGRLKGNAEKINAQGTYESIYIHIYVFTNILCYMCINICVVCFS